MYFLCLFFARLWELWIFRSSFLPTLRSLEVLFFFIWIFIYLYHNTFQQGKWQNLLTGVTHWKRNLLCRFSSWYFAFFLLWARQTCLKSSSHQGLLRVYLFFQCHERCNSYVFLCRSLGTLKLSLVFSSNLTFPRSFFLYLDFHLPMSIAIRFNLAGSKTYRLETQRLLLIQLTFSSQKFRLQLTGILFWNASDVYTLNFI